MGLGAFLLLILLLQLLESGWNQIVEKFGWVYVIIGLTLIIDGMEALSLTRQTPA